MNIKRITRGIKRRLSFIHSLSYKKFGKRSLIENPLEITGKEFMEIGNDVTIINGARIEAIPSWLNQELHPMLKIGDSTSFEQEAHLFVASNLTIGKNCVFSSRIFITTANHSFDRVDQNILKNEIIVKDVVIGDNCFVGMDVKIFPGVHIGDNVIVGANSIVTSDIPSYSVCVGTPAKVIKKYDFEQKKWVRTEE